MHRARWYRPGQRPASRRGQLADKTVKLTKRKASAALLPPVIKEGESLESVYQFHYLRCRFTAVTEAPPLRSECLLDPDAWQRGVDANAKSAGNAQWLQLSATAPHHREVVSRGGHQAFVQPSDGCADAEASLAGPYPAEARRPPSAPCSVGAGPTSWTPVPFWQPADGHTPPPKRTSPASRRLPKRWPIPLLSTVKPLRGETPRITMAPHSQNISIDPTKTRLIFSTSVMEK